MADVCEICQGRRAIDIPVYRAFDPGETVPEVLDNRVAPGSRTFACPECGPWAESDRLAVVRQEGGISIKLEADPRYLEHAKRDFAYKLGVALLEKGFIRFEDGLVDERRHSRTIYATVGVIASKTVANFEERVKAKSLDLAAEVIKAAIHEVRNWGSYYRGHHGDISKDRAAELMESAYKAVTGKYRGEP